MTITFTPEEVQQILVWHCNNLGMITDAEADEWVGSVYVMDGEIHAEVFHKDDRPS